MVLFGNEMNGIQYFRIPGLAKTKSGTLIAVADGRMESNNDIPNNIDCIIRRSTDNGKTWSNIQTLVDMGKDGVSDPSILIDKITDTIWIFLNYGKGVGIGGSQVGYVDSTIHILAIKSGDDGRTWTAPVDITTQVKAPDWKAVISSPGHGIQLKDGTLVQTGYYGVTTSVNPRAYAFYSQDHGKTWKRTPPVGQRLTEGMPVQLENGEVLINMRNNTNSRASSKTSNLAGAWGAVEYSPILIDPQCQASIIKLSTGDAAGKDWLVFGNPASTTRSNYVLRLSKDGGSSWSNAVSVWGQGAGYSDIVELDNGDIGVLYEKWHGNGTKAVLEFAIVPKKLLIKN
jgi:sialidase-1